MLKIILFLIEDVSDWADKIIMPTLYTLAEIRKLPNNTGGNHGPVICILAVFYTCNGCQYVQMLLYLYEFEPLFQDCGFATKPGSSRLANK